MAGYIWTANTTACLISAATSLLLLFLEQQQDYSFLSLFIRGGAGARIELTHFISISNGLESVQLGYHSGIRVLETSYFI
jgi:hypothetical protein